MKMVMIIIIRRPSGELADGQLVCVADHLFVSQQEEDDRDNHLDDDDYLDDDHDDGDDQDGP